MPNNERFIYETMTRTCVEWQYDQTTSWVLCVVHMVLKKKPSISCIIVWAHFTYIAIAMTSRKGAVHLRVLAHDHLTE